MTLAVRGPAQNELHHSSRWRLRHHTPQHTWQCAGVIVAATATAGTREVEESAAAVLCRSWEMGCEMSGCLAVLLLLPANPGFGSALVQ